MALMKDPVTGKIVPAPPSIVMTPVKDPTHVVTEVNVEEKKIVVEPIEKSVPSIPHTIAKQNPVVANLPKEVQPLVEREIAKRLEFAGSVDRSSILARIKVVLGQQGMDSQQQEKALQMIREILEG